MNEEEEEQELCGNDIDVSGDEERRNRALMVTYIHTYMYLYLHIRFPWRTNKLLDGMDTHDQV